jgi:hypothetical protein
MSRPKGLPEAVGRHEDTPNQRTRDFHAAVEEAGVTPLAYMLQVMRDEKAEPERRDRMAAAAAPFIHPQLSNVEAKMWVSIPIVLALVRGDHLGAFASHVRRS